MSDKASIWKKEISFRRKPKAKAVEKQSSTPAAPQTPPAPPAAAPPIQLPPVESTWPATGYSPIETPGPVETPAPVAPEVIASPEFVAPTSSFEMPVTPVDDAPPVLPAAVPTFHMPPVESTWPETGYSPIETPGPVETPAPVAPEVLALPEFVAPAPSFETPVPPVDEPAWEPSTGYSAFDAPAPVETPAPAAPDVVAAPTPVEAPISVEASSDSASIWKKELSFRRKPKAKTMETHSTRPVAPPGHSEPMVPEVIVASALVQAQTSVATPPATPVDEAKPAKRSRFGRGEKEPKAEKPGSDLKVSEPNVKKEKQKKVKGDKQRHGERTVVGLRVGSSHLSAACIHANGSIEVTKLVRTALYPGVVVGGEVRDPESLGRELKTFFATNKLPRKNVRLGLASNRIGVRVIEVPKIDDPRLLANAIRFRAQEALSISVADAVLDHVVLGDTTTESGEPAMRVLLVFAHRDIVDSYVEAFERAGVKLAGIDFEAFALLRALGEPRAETVTPTQAIIALTIGHDRTIFAVSDGRICDFTRVLDWGGASLNAALARVLDITPAEAEVLKRRLSLVGELGDVGLSPIEVETVRDALRRELQVLAREFVSSLQFYQGRPGSLDIGEVLVTGGGAQLGGLPEEFQRLVGVPVHAGDPFGRVTFAANLERPEEVGSLAIAVGLGIDD